MFGKFLENVCCCIYEFAAPVYVLRQPAPKFLQFLRVLRSQCRHADPSNGKPSRTPPGQEQPCTCGKGTENQRLFPVHLLPLLNLQSCYAVRANGLPARCPFCWSDYTDNSQALSDSFLVVRKRIPALPGRFKIGRR